MAKYVVKTGQNLFDVALSLYGSIEGLLDLMTNNPGLSIDTEIMDGDELEYTPYYYEDTTVIDFYKANGVVPSNRVGNIYYKDTKGAKIWVLLPSDIKMYGFSVSGSGTMYVDWGDNSDIEKIPLTGDLRQYHHSADNVISESRKMRIYGDFSVNEIDMTDMRPNMVMMFTPIDVGKFILRDARHLMSVDFIEIFNAERTMSVDLGGSRVDDLTHLLGLTNVDLVNLGYCRLSGDAVDRYLIGLVENYGIRRNCTLNFLGSGQPSGEYRKPENMLHPKTGMEAIWVLVNEHREASGPWKIILNNKTYT